MRGDIFLLLCIILLAASLRFFHLGSVPIGFIPEEVSTGWSSYTLLKTGADEWGTRLPIIFRETGGYKLVLNGYLMAPVVALLGLNEAAVRATTATAGVLAVLLTYPVTILLLRNRATRLPARKVALLAALLLSISPWHISMSRYGVDVNWGVPLFLAGLWSFLTSLRHPKWLIPAGIFFSLTYYTYFNYIVFTVLFVGALVLLYRRQVWDVRMRRYLAGFFLIQILAFLPYLLTNNLFTRFSQATSVQSVGLLNMVNEHRGACLTQYPLLVCRALYNMPSAKIQEIVRNAVNHFSVTTLFLYGSNRGLSGMPERWGLLYLFEFPFLVLGLYFLIRNRAVPPIMVVWGLLYGLPSALAGDGHIWRMMTILPLPQIIGGYGLCKFSIFISQFSMNFKIKNYNLIENLKLEIVHYLKPLVYTGILFFICFSFLHFLTDYFGFFPYAQGQYSYYGFRNLYSYLRTVEDRYDHIVIAPVGMGFNQLYIYYLFYNRFDPAVFQHGVDVDRRMGEQGWVWVDRIGKYYFVGEADKVRYPLTEKTLLVIDGSGTNSKLVVKDPSLDAQTIHTIFFPNGDPAFVVMELIKISP